MSLTGLGTSFQTGLRVREATKDLGAFVVLRAIRQSPPLPLCRRPSGLETPKTLVAVRAGVAEAGFPPGFRKPASATLIRPTVFENGLSPSTERAAGTGRRSIPRTSRPSRRNRSYGFWGTNFGLWPIRVKTRGRFAAFVGSLLLR
jgi:hypothetical protein